MKSFLNKNVVFAAVLAGNVFAADSFKVKVTGHGQVKVKPDEIQSRFSAVNDCNTTEEASKKAWEAQLKTVTDALNAKVSDLTIKADANTYKSARIQRVRVKGSKYPYQYTYQDTCAAAGKEAVSVADLVDADGNISEDAFGVKYTTQAYVTVSTPSTNTRLLQDAVVDLDGVSFATVTPAGTVFKLTTPRSGSITSPSVSEKLRKKNERVARRRADRNAQNLLKAFEKLGFDQVPGSKPVLSRNTQTVYVQHETNKQGEITAQKMGLNFKVRTEAVAGVETEVNVTVDATKTFAADYYEATVNAKGDCYATREAAEAARKAFVAAMDKNVMAHYQNKSETFGVDRQDPRDVNSRNVANNLTNIQGRVFTSEKCVLPEGAMLTEWTGKADQTFWSFNEYYTARDAKASLRSKAVKGAEKSASETGVEVTVSKPAKRYLDTAEKGQRRTAVLRTLNERKVNDAVCDALANDEFSGTTGVIVGCEISDQNDQGGFGARGFALESAAMADMSPKSARAASVDSSNELALQAVEVTTTLEVEVFNKTVK